MPLLLQAADLVTADGTLYREFKIQGVNDDSLSIIHADGSVQVAFTNLPPEMQDRWLEKEKDNTPEKPTAPPPAQLPEIQENRAAAELFKVDDLTIELERHYHTFYKGADAIQLFPEPLTLSMLQDGWVYKGSQGVIKFQRSSATYSMHSSNTNVFSVDTSDRLILRSEGSAFLTILVNGAKQEFPVDVKELPLRAGMTPDEVRERMGEPDIVKDIKVEWPDDKRIDHIRYKGYLPAEEWKGIPKHAAHWSWHKFPGAVVSLAQDQHGKSLLYQVSSGPSMTEKALDQTKKP